MIKETDSGWKRFLLRCDRCDVTAGPAFKTSEDANEFVNDINKIGEYFHKTALGRLYCLGCVDALIKESKKCW